MSQGTLYEVGRETINLDDPLSGILEIMVKIVVILNSISSSRNASKSSKIISS